MDIEKEAFIQMILGAKILRFGDFTLKSGRASPYFFNAGLFYEGVILKRVGDFYASTLLRNQPEATHLFGPAYKGLPLATATAIACAEKGVNVSVTFNRKEVKAHGEGGLLMGAPLEGRKVAMIDDVITAGTAFRESKALIEAEGGHLKTVVIALDREERGAGSVSTLSEIKASGIQVFSIITFSDLMDYLRKNSEITHLKQLENYRAQYGA
ncbi:MAG: orotate phosphoribosyltransferase [Legionellaceae bacterium]|nr:orotate phosphoribosyltransferase [Legionellaceae bacterium]